MATTFLFKLLYFVQYSGFGILSPYMPIFYESLEMSKSQIGILTMMPNVCSFLVAPIFGFIGDKFSIHGEVLVTAIYTSTLSTIASLYIISQLPIVLVTSILRSPIGPGIDSIVMASLADKTTYGTMRLWGAVSFGFCSLLGGYLTAAPNLHQNRDSPFIVLFYAYAMASVLSGYIILCVLYSDTPQHTGEVRSSKTGESTTTAHNSEEETNIENRNSTNSSGLDASCEGNSDAEDIPTLQQPSHSIGSALLQVVSEKPIILVFSVVVFLSGFGAGAIDSYLFLHLKELGGSGLVMGIARFITCAAEVPMFHVAGGLQKRYGTWPMIALTQLAFVVRFVYYVLLRNPWAVLPCEALNGLTFAVTWSVSCTYANEIAPPGCHAVVQALLEGLHFGFGSGVGSLVGGFIYEYYGAVRLFQVCALLSALSTVLATSVWWLCARHINHNAAPLTTLILSSTGAEAGAATSSSRIPKMELQSVTHLLQQSQRRGTTQYSKLEQAEAQEDS